jgi:hypothetical protein
LGSWKLNKSFEQTYPNITRWVEAYGWIEIGQDEYSDSLIRAINEGGIAWEGDDDYRTLDEALQALEAGLAEWIDD